MEVEPEPLAAKPNGFYLGLFLLRQVCDEGGDGVGEGEEGSGGVMDGVDVTCVGDEGAEGG